MVDDFSFGFVVPLLVMDNMIKGKKCIHHSYYSLSLSINIIFSLSHSLILSLSLS